VIVQRLAFQIVSEL